MQTWVKICVNIQICIVHICTICKMCFCCRQGEPRWKSPSGSTQCFIRCGWLLYRRECFKDSPTAQHFKSASTRTTCIINQAVAQHYRNELVMKMRGNPLVTDGSKDTKDLRQLNCLHFSCRCLHTHAELVMYHVLTAPDKQTFKNRIIMIINMIVIVINASLGHGKYRLIEEDQPSCIPKTAPSSPVLRNMFDLIGFISILFD